jgi:hypothetical protein
MSGYPMFTDMNIGRMKQRLETARDGHVFLELAIELEYRIGMQDVQPQRNKYWQNIFLVIPLYGCHT